MSFRQDFLQILASVLLIVFRGVTHNSRQIIILHRLETLRAKAKLKPFELYNLKQTAFVFITVTSIFETCVIILSSVFATKKHPIFSTA